MTLSPEALYTQVVLIDQSKWKRIPVMYIYAPILWSLPNSTSHVWRRITHGALGYHVLGIQAVYSGSHSAQWVPGASYQLEMHRSDPSIDRVRIFSGLRGWRARR